MVRVWLWRTRPSAVGLARGVFLILSAGAGLVPGNPAFDGLGSLGLGGGMVVVEGLSGEAFECAYGEHALGGVGGVEFCDEAAEMLRIGVLGCSGDGAGSVGGVGGVERGLG